MCDNKRITVYKGDIQSFKMDMRTQMGMTGQQKGLLRGDASVLKKESEDESTTAKTPSTGTKKVTYEKKDKPQSSVEKKDKMHPEDAITTDSWGTDDNSPASLRDLSSLKDDLPKKSRYVPPHLRKKSDEAPPPTSASRYVPPHLRNKS